MKISEFDLIEAFFRGRSERRADVVLSIGDDCALLEIPPGKLLAVTVDTLVAGVHFLPETAPEGLGHKSLAVSLSDLAAMGSTPAWLTLSLTLPGVDKAWLERFVEGFFSLARECGAVLVGGDLSRGPLSITVQAHGFVPVGGGLRRSGARVGDVILVTGTVGDAGLGLDVVKGRQSCTVAARSYLCGRLERPTPRVDAGMALLTLASAAIDVSDGLAQDLTHLLEASGAGASVSLDALPLSDAVRETLPVGEARRVALTAGDDYELCFTCPQANVEAVCSAMEACDTRVTEIGRVEGQPGLRLVADAVSVDLPATTGYRHF